MAGPREDTKSEQQPSLPHLSELHARAQELGVPKFRGLRKDELAAEIAKREKGGRASRAKKRKGSSAGLLGKLKGLFGGGGEKGRAKPKPKQKRGGKGAGARPGDADAFEIVGKLDRMPRGYGFVRVGEGKSDEDVYLSPSQIRRCSVKPGDEVKGLAREPRKGERHRAMVRVIAVNGKDV